MEKIEIDNVKMLEFFRRALEKRRDTAKGTKYLELDSYIKIFDDALKDQGLEYRDGSIISILEQTAIRIEKGNWYACSCEIVNDNKTIVFPIDEIYYCPKDGYIDVKGMLFEVGSLYRYFRPATEEEINKHLFVKDSSLNTAKDELTEFEQMLVSLILRTEKTILTPDGLAKEFAPKLMNLARKQICSEINIDMFCSNIGYVNGIYTGNDMNNAYRLGAAEMLNKIKEG